ncbi:MAG: ABC transporter permease [Saprospiraceae bacterium]
MVDVNKVRQIILKDWKVESRQSFAIYGILLFAATTVFIVFKSFNSINPREWSILLWIILLFSGLNAVLKSFLQEKKETWSYYYTLFNPIEILISKLFYNFLFLALLFLLITILMNVFMGNPIRFLPMFISGNILGIIGVSIVFTFVSLVSASIDGSHHTMMAVLSMPLILPIILLSLKVTQVSTGLLVDTSIYTDIWLLFGIDILLFGVVLILFPYLWRA